MKIICIGRNYRNHVKEMNSETPDKPVFFLKADSCLQKDSRPFFIPDFSKELHFETELVLRICKVGKSISKKFANRYYDSITVGIDFTARDLQRECKKNGLPWEISKSFDQSARLGKFIPSDKLKLNDNIKFWLRINDEIVQSGNSTDMIFDADKLISYVSKFMTLKTGDLIYTGTPEGVDPVKRGDILEAGIGDKSLLKFPVW